MFMRGASRFSKKGSKFDKHFFYMFSVFLLYLMRGEKIHISLLADHHWPASETPFKRHLNADEMMAWWLCNL